MLYNWGAGDVGWALGSVLHCNRDGRAKDRGIAANFVVQYSSGGSAGGTNGAGPDLYETNHNFQLNEYALSPESPQHSWALVVPAVQHAGRGAASFTQMRSTDHLAPEGFRIQECLPPNDALTVRSPLGATLLQRKFLQKWPGHGWCLAAWDYHQAN